MASGKVTLLGTFCLTVEFSCPNNTHVPIWRNIAVYGPNDHPTMGQFWDEIKSCQDPAFSVDYLRVRSSSPMTSQAALNWDDITNTFCLVFDFFLFNSPSLGL